MFMKKHLSPGEMFKRVNELVAGSYHRRQIIECSGCRAEGFYHDTSKGWIAPQVVAQRFSQMGWSVGRDRRRDLCAACAVLAGELRDDTLAQRPTPVLVSSIAELLPAGPPRLTERRKGAHTFVYAPHEPVEGRKNQPFATAGFGEASHARKSAQRFLRRCGVNSPKEDRDFTVFREAEAKTWAWAIAPAAPEDTRTKGASAVMTTAKANLILVAAYEEPGTPILPPPVVPAPANDHAPTIRASVTADEPRRATPVARRVILDALEADYLDMKGCYRGDLSDHKLAVRLNLPAAWVAEVRDMMLGGPDMNEHNLALTQADLAVIKRCREMEEQAMQLASAWESMRHDYERRIGKAS